MRALEFITGHVIFKLRYNQIYQLKTTEIYVDQTSFLKGGYWMFNSNYPLTYPLTYPLYPFISNE